MNAAGLRLRVMDRRHAGRSWSSAGDDLVLLVLGGAGELVAREQRERGDDEPAADERGQHQDAVNHGAANRPLRASRMSRAAMDLDTRTTARERLAGRIARRTRS